MVELRYIITGGPGAGKTTLLEALTRAGHACSEEVSRQLIIEEVGKASDCLPWKDLPCFAGRVLTGMMHAYDEAAGHLTFFDRGIPDIIAYLEAAALPVTAQYYQAIDAHPYARTVFLLPPWEEIYVQDTERWQTFAEAVLLHRHIRTAYEEAGYHLVEVPKASPEERVLFIQKSCRL